MATTAKFKGSLEKVIEAIAASCFLTEKDGQGVPIMIYGNPGVGKSAFIKILSGIMGYEFLDIELNSREPEDLKGYMTTPDKVDSEFVSASTIIPDWYKRILDWTNQGKKVILFFDEINTASSPVQAAALTLIQGREFKGVRLPDTVTMVAAGNYFENLNMDDMQPMVTVLNRFCILNVNVQASTAGRDDFEVLLRRYDSVEDTGNQFSWKEAYLDVYSDKITKFNEKALIEESKDEKHMREMLEKYVADEVVATAQRLVDTDKAIDINDKRLSGIYSECPTKNGDLYNVLTPRSLDNLIQMAGGFYRMWGVDSLTSDSFADVICGLVGIGIEPKGSKSSSVEDVKYKLLGKEFYNAIKSAVETFKLKSDTSIQKRVNVFDSFINNAVSNSKTNKKKLSYLSETEFNNLKEYLDNFGKDVNVAKPIDVKKVKDMFNYLINTVKADKNFEIPVAKAGSAIAFNVMDEEQKLNYINNSLDNHFKHWSEWFSVVKSFVKTFGSAKFGYSQILTTADLMYQQQQAINFFGSVNLEIDNNQELANNVNAQIKPLIDRMEKNKLRDNVFELPEAESNYLFQL